MSACAFIPSIMSAAKPSSPSSAQSRPISPASSPSEDLLLPRAPPKSASPALLRSHEIITTFTPEPFNAPFPSNPHIETILPVFYPRPPILPTHTQTLPSTDGTTLLSLDLASATTPATPLSTFRSLDIALVLHGLESNSASPQTVRIGAALADANFAVALLNFRTCAPDAPPVPNTARAYHAGFYEDALAVLAALHPSNRVYLVGFSLGANVVANLLGALARAPPPSTAPVVAAVGLSTPWDPAGAQRRIDAGFSRVVYARMLTKTIVAKVVAAAEGGVTFPEEMDLDTVKAVKTIGGIDDAYIAPVFGFQGKEDYYARVDSRQFLSGITVPSYFFGARNDPFFSHGRDEKGRESASLPTEDDVAGAPVLVYTSDVGGHCGFGDWEGYSGSGAMYAPREIARFCSHVREGLDRVNKLIGYPADQNVAEKSQKDKGV